MSFSGHEKIILITIGVLIILIPITSFVIAYKFRAQTTSKAATDTTAKRPVSLGDTLPKDSTPSSALESLKNNLNDTDSEDYGVSQGSSPASSATPVPQIILGPSLSFQAKIEGRTHDQTSKQFFIGIAEGQNPTKPQYLLSFKVDLPSSGVYTGLSLSGLTSGSTYTAFLKGKGQIATSSAFVLGPNETNLGEVNLLTGDLNEDNLINASDLSVALTAYNGIPSSDNWNDNVDFNKDSRVNNFDLAYIYKNYNQTGAGGAWFSKLGGAPTLPTIATQSATGSSSGSLAPNPSGSESALGNPELAPPPNSSKGYWIWMPTN